MSRIKQQPQILKAQWGKVDGTPDLCYVWGQGVDRCDARLLHNTFAVKNWRPKYDGTNEFYFAPSFFEELEERGYDMTTFKFSIKKKSV